MNNLYKKLGELINIEVGLQIERNNLLEKFKNYDYVPMKLYQIDQEIIEANKKIEKERSVIDKKEYEILKQQLMAVRK